MVIGPFYPALIEYPNGNVIAGLIGRTHFFTHTGFHLITEEVRYFYST
jgi:hypothetical protein